MVRTAIIPGFADDDPIQSNIERIDDGVYAGVETGVSLALSDVLSDSLAETELTVPSIMTGFEAVRGPSQELLNACDAVDCHRVVLGYLPESHFVSPDVASETARTLSECVDELAAHGITLCYHNHDHEFVDFDDRTAFETFVDRLDNRIQFEVDVAWVGVGGESPAEFIETYGDRIPSIHLKDMDFEREAFVPLGEGDLDLNGVIEAAIEQDVDWLIYEDERECPVRDKIDHGSAVLEEYASRDEVIL
ncbi:sugar phosphate isomerase/epimerase family protein [Halomontanus rarus]|uniref:sugar phosphate isomerase/epimerase family protein n=1 Tax=Halomontanus rarus TaxID=3034020 RepID=UPI0023E7BEB8|nr:sugar phosphate isomerase/epimerase [Halovivax sp. TS33]